jgi:hypothetical protein
LCIVYVRDAQKFGGSTAPRTVFFVLGGIGLCSLHVSGLGGKSGRRGGSKRKKKHISPHMPPQALFPQHPPISDSTHTPQTHPHLPHLPECSRKGRECSRKGRPSNNQQSQVRSSGTAAVGSFVGNGSNSGPLGVLGVGIYQRQVHFSQLWQGAAIPWANLYNCSQAILRVVPSFFSHQFSSHPDLFALFFS